MMLLPLLLAAAVQSPVVKVPLITVRRAPGAVIYPLAGMSAQGRALVAAEMPIDAQRKAKRKARYDAAMARLKSVLAASSISPPAVAAALAERDRILDENRRSQSAAAVEMLKRLSESDRRIVARSIIRSPASD